MRIKGKCIVRTFYCVVLCIAIWGIAYQRLLVVEARNMHIYQTYMSIAATRCIINEDNQQALHWLQQSQRVSVDYMAYRKIMLLRVIDVINSYLKVKTDSLSYEREKELLQYSDEVFACNMSGRLNYYNIVDHWVLPKTFYFFVPKASNKEMRR